MATLQVLNSAVQMPCWSCSVSHVESTLFCPHCSRIQPPPGVDFFSALGLTPHLQLDLAALEKEFHRLSRQLHPDRYARATNNEKEWSLADTALINDAYRTLKDPLRRTEYLLKLMGEETSNAERKDKKNLSRVPADLLEEAFDLNMQLEEMRAARKANAQDVELQSQLEEAKKKFTTMLSDVDRDLRVEWTRWDEGDELVRKVAQKAMVAQLDRRRYLSNLVRDVNEVLGA
jgi:molecular chaperone HscB